MIKTISYLDILGDPKAESLFAEYAAESSISEIGEINPQTQLYAAMDASGMLRCFGAYDGERLIGFATTLLYSLPHYGKKIATVESIFVAKDERSSGAGRELMEAVEEYAKGAGCVAILYTAPVGSQLERLLNVKRAYRQTNSVFTRSLR
jgi:GNAT superfamily N-acetyltransferase